MTGSVFEWKTPEVKETSGGKKTAGLEAAVVRIGKDAQVRPTHSSEDGAGEVSL